MRRTANNNFATAAELALAAMYLYNNPDAWGAAGAASLYLVLNTIRRCITPAPAVQNARPAFGNNRPIPTAEMIAAASQLMKSTQNQIRHMSLATTTLNTLAPLLKGNEQGFKPFIDSVSAGNFNQALRRACTSTHPDAFHLVTMLLANKEQLGLNVNERAGDAQLTALDYAMKNSSAHRNALCELLHAHGAHTAVSLPDNKF